jgi:hypothetical protein
MSTTNPKPKPSLLAAVERAPTERKPSEVPVPAEARGASPSVAKRALVMGVLGAGANLVGNMHKDVPLARRAADALSVGAGLAAFTGIVGKTEGMPVAVRLAAGVAAGWRAQHSVGWLTKAAGVEFGRRPYVRAAGYPPKSLIARPRGRRQRGARARASR